MSELHRTPAQGASGFEPMVLQALPPLPANAAALVKLMADDEAPTLKIVQLIEEDVALASRLVGLANSSFYALPNPVLSVKDAVLRVLGLDLARGVVLSAIFGAALDYRACHSFQVERFWRESLLVAAVSRSLCLSSTGSLGDHAATGYLCGLMLRLGLLGLAAVRPGPTAAVLSATEPPTLRLRLEAEFGRNHRQIGADIARQWQIPEPIPSIIGGEVAPGRDSLPALLTSSVELAAAMATHEIDVSGASAETSQPHPAGVEPAVHLDSAVADVQGQCAMLHQQAQNIAATL